MPIDYGSLQAYQIDYKELYEYFYNFPFLNSSYLKKWYLRHWLKILKKYDDILVSKFNNPSKQMLQYIKLNVHKSQIFRQEINYNNVKVFIHFQVDKLNELLKENSTFAVIDKMALDEFQTNASTIKWTECAIDLSRNFNSDPIYIVPLIFDQYTKLTIDGNHRLSHAIKNHHNQIASISLSEQFVIKHKIFPNDFDHMFYIFHSELNHFLNYKIRNFYTDIKLIKNSYLFVKNCSFKECFSLS